MTEESNKYEKRLNTDLLFDCAKVGDLNNIKILIEEKGIDVNSTDHSLTALSVCAAKSGDKAVVEYLLSKGAQIGDSYLHAIKAGINAQTVQLLLSKMTKNQEMSPVKDSAVFQPYMTPFMLASICGHRHLIELLMSRGHTIPIPHMADCECDDCNVSSTHVSTPSQRNLDIYRALCNPAYIGLNSSDPVSKAFELESESRSVIENSNYFSHHYKDMSTKMENYVIDVINVTRDAEEVKVMVKQNGVQPRPNAFIKYLMVQNAVDHHWVDFIASKRIESLRSHLWLGHRRDWFQSGVKGLSRKFVNSWIVILGQLFLGIGLISGYQKHITAQSRYLCRLFNESMFAFILLYFLTKNPLTENSTLSSVVKLLIIVWTFANIINITKKWAIFGVNKLWRFYGHLFELVITSEMILIITLWLMCNTDTTTNTTKPTEDSEKKLFYELVNKSEDIEMSTCVELRFILLRLLVKLIYVRLVLLSSLRAYKGSTENTVIRLFLLSFCLISVFYPVFSTTVANNYKWSTFDATLGMNMFGDIDPTLVFLVINFLIGLLFEIVSGPEKIADKFWCYHWTARLIYEIHGACELAVPFNILETHRVLFILLKRVGIKVKIREKDIKQYDWIKSLVYSRYESIKYLETKSHSDHSLGSKTN